MRIIKMTSKLPIIKDKSPAFTYYNKEWLTKMTKDYIPREICAMLNIANVETLKKWYNEFGIEWKGNNSPHIHHIDGNPDNNNDDNLFVYNSGREHRLAHGQLQRIAYQLIKDGLIKFDKEKGVYFI